MERRFALPLAGDKADVADVSRLLAAAAKIIERVRYCWLVTTDEDGGARSRPMGRVPRDADEDEWTIRFLTDGRSHKVADLRRVGQVSIILQHDPEDAFIALTGKASLAESKAVSLDMVSNGRIRNCSRFLSQEKRWRPSHILIAKSWHETCLTSIL